MCSNHSIERTVERAGLNRRAAIRMIENARIKGKASQEFGRCEREYLQRKESEGRRLVIYAGYCFLFDEDNVCITMFAVPVWFGKKQYRGKTEIRKPKKYRKMYSEDIECYAV